MLKKILLYGLAIVILAGFVSASYGSSANYDAYMYFGAGGLSESTVSYDVDVGYGQSVIGTNETSGYDIGHGLFYISSGAAPDIESIILLLLEGINGTHTQLPGDVNITGYMIDPTVGNLTIYYNGTYLDSNTSSYVQNITSWAVGHYNITLFYPGGPGYLPSQQEHLLIIRNANYYYINYTDTYFDNQSSDVLCFEMRGSTICFDSRTNTTFWE